MARDITLIWFNDSVQVMRVDIIDIFDKNYFNKLRHVLPCVRFVIAMYICFTQTDFTSSTYEEGICS